MLEPLPGTDEKIELLRQRAERGVPLFDSPENLANSETILRCLESRQHKKQADDCRQTDIHEPLTPSR